MVTLLTGCGSPAQGPRAQGAPAPGASAPRPTTPTPTAQTEEVDDSSMPGADWGPTSVIFGVVSTTVVAGAVLLVVRRRRRSPTFSFSGHGSASAPLPIRTETTPGRHLAPSGAADVAVLVEALRQLAVAAPGAAIRQQIERLLDAGAGRDDLLLACIRYRDQLAEQDPATGDRLLAALRSVGVKEIRGDGELFTPCHHESVDVTTTPRSELHDQVAQTTRLGYRDGARVVRLPQVVVYRFAPPGAPGSQL